MTTIEFETELIGRRSLEIPTTVFDYIPSSGKAIVQVHVDLDPEDCEWRKASYEQFLRDDSDEDAVYDRYC